MATTLNRILVATDLSLHAERAVQRAGLLAQRDGAELLIVHAKPRTSALRNWFGDDSVVQTLERGAASALDGLVRGLSERGVKVRGEVVEGKAYRAVAESVEMFQPDLVVIGAHGEGAVSQFFLGGTAAKLIDCSARPTLIVRGEARSDYRSLLIGLDLGTSSGAVLAMAQAVGSGARYTALHAYQAPHEGRMRVQHIPEDSIASYVARGREQALETLRQLLREAGSSFGAVVPRIESGHPNAVIPQVAREIDGDLIAVARHGGDRFEEAVLGSVPRFLAYHAHCDVLIV